MENTKKMLVFCGSDDPHKALPPFMLGCGAQALDMDLTLFFTLSGLNIIRRGYAEKIQLPGAPKTLPEFLKIAKENGARFIACSAALATGEATYWSRSRAALWRKGETSGHLQKVVEIRLDCDSDAILLRVEQVGGIACHTGRRRCFYKLLEGGAAAPRWRETDPVLADPGRSGDGG